MLINGLVVFGAKYLIGVVLLLTALFWFRQTKPVRKESLIRAIFAFPGTFIVARLGSMLYYDTRPFVVLNVVPLVAHAADNGFPSDHTLLTAACAALVFTQNKKWGVALFALSILIGTSRVLAQVHHVTDIVGSLVIAGVVALLVYYLQKYFSKRHLQKTANPV